MADHYWPTLLEPASTRLEIQDSAGRFQSPTTGYTRTISRPGERMRLSLNFQNLNAERRAALQSLIARLQGAAHRVLAHDHSNRIRGSFPSAELLTNNTFADGTTGWTVASEGALTVADRVGRFTALTGAGAFPAISQSIGLTQYAPHILRSIVIDGSQSSGLLFGPAINDGVQTQINDYSTTRGLRAAVMVALGSSATNQYPLVFASPTGYTAGAFVEIPWFSLSRCALVDNAPNAFLRSDELDNAYWTKTELSVDANFHTAPDGTVTAERLVESTANSQHFITRNETRASLAEDWCISGIFARSSGTRDVRLVIGRDAATNFSFCRFTLTGSGTAGTPVDTGDNSNGRAFIRSMGNGYYYCALVARLAASTQVSAYANLVNAGSDSYTGDGTSALAAWRFGAAPSGVPHRLGQTTTTAVASGTSQSPAGPLHSKGWPVSTNDLLLPGDQVQIGNQLHIVISPVNSDAAGLATLECYPARRSAPADNAPVVINQPLGRFFLEPDVNGWSNKPGIFSDAEIVLAEAS